MNKSLKIMLITGAVLIGIGIIIVLAVGFSSNWQVTEKAEYKTYVTEVGAEITDIDLDFSAGPLNVEFYDGDVIKVEYPETKQITTECKVTGKTLKINTVVHWHVQFLWFNRIPATKVYIPQNMHLGLKMNVSAGTVSFGKGEFTDVNVKISAGSISMGDTRCNSFDLTMSAGALNVKSLQSNSIDLDLSAGSANIKVAGKRSDYTIRTDVSAGSCNVSNQSGGSKLLTVDVSAGSANISFEE